MSAAPIEAVLFDAAGTLIVPREPVGETYARVARQFGVSIPAWRLGDAFARVLRAAPAMVFPGETPERVRALERAWWRERVRATFRAADAGARLRDPDGCFEALFRRYARAEAWLARPGAGQVLAALRARGLRAGVLSNFDHRLPGILAGLGLLEPLDAVVLPGDTGIAKPDPRAFADALERLGVPAARAVCVGDDPARDLAAARAAGLRAIDAASLATLAELPARLARL